MNAFGIRAILACPKGGVGRAFRSRNGLLMNIKTVGTLFWRLVLLGGAFAAAGATQAADLKSVYASMAPLDQYLMADRQTEISLARTAAPGRPLVRWNLGSRTLT
jgi:hypothetical protein